MWQKSLKTQLLLAFILFALIPITILGQFIYNTVYDSHIHQILSNLNKIADKKVEQINSYSYERLSDSNLLANSPTIATDIERLLSVFYHEGIHSKNYQQLELSIRDSYQNMIKIGGYYDVFLIAPHGDIIFTIKHEADFATNLYTGAYNQTELARIFTNARELLISDFSSYRYYAPSRKDAAFVAAPVLKNHHLIGVVALQINSQLFQQVIQDNMNLGQSAETVVARTEGQQGHFLFPLRFKSAIQNNLIDLNAKVGLPILHALKGENTSGISLDYRGEKVVAAWRYIPSAQIGIAVKIDLKEALAPFNKVQWLQSFYFFAIVTCVGLIALYLRKFLLEPVDALMLTTDKIAKGDFKQRVTIMADNEIGRLAHAFNRMVEHVQEVYDSLENQVQERTLHLKTVNNLLTEQILKREAISAELKRTLAFKQALLNSNNFSIISTTLNGTILSFNAAAEKMLGYKAEELVNRHTPELIHDADEVIAQAKRLSQELGRTVEPGFEVFVTKTDQGPDENEWTYIRKDGSRFPVWLSVTAIVNEKKEKIGYLGIASDISERKRMIEELQLAYNVIEHTSEGILITNSKNIITNVNPAYSRIMGYEKEEVIGKNPGFAKSNRHDKSFYKQMWNKIYNEGCWEGEIWDRRKDGTVFPKWLTINVIKSADDRILHYVGIFMDISQQKATEEKLERLAFYDPLTQLPNRALFRERLTQELLKAKRHQSHSAVFFIDLDRFKWVNDNLGHDVGDELLIAVAARIKEQIRQSDSVCRLGGDEFTVILCNLPDTHKLGAIAQGIISSLQTVFELKGHEIFIGASIGIATYPEHGEDFTTLVKNADIAMYEAKNAGRGTYRFYQAVIQRK